MEAFSGGAQDTLKWLINRCIPYVEACLEVDCCTRLIGGYSLAGLFSLYAFYESGAFSGAASCSGSLWYPGWTEYMQTRKAPQQSSIYLSLGRKEEKARNPLINTVGEKTRWQYEQILHDENVRTSAFVLNNGGHFTDVETRIAQGFAWLIENAAVIKQNGPFKTE